MRNASTFANDDCPRSRNHLRVCGNAQLRARTTHAVCRTTTSSYSLDLNRDNLILRPNMILKIVRIRTCRQIRLRNEICRQEVCSLASRRWLKVIRGYFGCPELQFLCTLRKLKCIGNLTFQKLLLSGQVIDDEIFEKGSLVRSPHIGTRSWKPSSQVRTCRVAKCTCAEKDSQSIDSCNCIRIVRQHSSRRLLCDHRTRVGWHQHWIWRK